MRVPITEIINLTPHAIHLMDNNKNVIKTFEPSGVIARCAQTTERIGELELDGITCPVSTSVFGEVTDLPEPKEGVGYIVSLLTAQAAASERDDLFITNEAVRDDVGRIIGCMSLGKI